MGFCKMNVQELIKLSFFLIIIINFLLKLFDDKAKALFERGKKSYFFNERAINAYN